MQNFFKKLNIGPGCFFPDEAILELSFEGLIRNELESLLQKLDANRSRGQCFLNLMVVDQGCQIFLRTKNIPIDHKIYQLTTKYTN
jgi:hypothetical protein